MSCWWWWGYQHFNCSNCTVDENINLFPIFKLVILIDSCKTIDLYQGSARLKLALFKILINICFFFTMHALSTVNSLSSNKNPSFLRPVAFAFCIQFVLCVNLWSWLFSTGWQLDNKGGLCTMLDITSKLLHYVYTWELSLEVQVPSFYPISFLQEKD
jgi:hypothetical protein